MTNIRKGPSLHLPLACLKGMHYFVLLFFLIACNDDQINKDPEKQDEVVIYTPHAKLGKKLKNPYSIRNIQKAKTLLNPNNNRTSESNDLHYYIRFKPLNAEEAAQLVAENLNLYDFPFDYEVLEMSDDGYQEYAPQSGEVYPWLYTVVDQDYKIPNLPYEMLDTLYFPKDDEDDLEYMAHYISGNLEDQVNPTGRTNLLGLGKKRITFIFWGVSYS